MEWVKVEPTSLVGAWGTQKQEIWRIFAKLLGYFKICLQIVWASGAKRGGLKTSATKNLLPCITLWGSLTALPTWDCSRLRWWTDNCSATHCFSWGVKWKHDCMCITSLGMGCLQKELPFWGSMASSANTVPVSTSVTTLRFTEVHNGPCFPGTGICAIYESCFTHVCRGPGDVSDEPDWLRASSGCSAHQNSMGPCSFSGTWSMSGASFTPGTRSVHGFRHVHILYNCIKLCLCRVIGTDQVHHKLTSTIRD